MFKRFHDRTEGGQLLAEQLAAYAEQDNLLVLALPRGGVVTGFAVAQKLGAPLDVLIVRKLGVPGQEELAMGAIASGGVRVLNEDVLRYLNPSNEEIEAAAARELQELQRRERAYRGERPAPVVRGRTVILVDDGIATGTTMRSAVEALKQRRAARIIVAAPVAAAESCAEFNAYEGVAACVCLVTPEPFIAVGLWYEEFAQTTDEEVRDLLARAPSAPAAKRARKERKA
jgi:predicted phosphoribosyltransferase